MAVVLGPDTAFDLSSKEIFTLSKCNPFQKNYEMLILNNYDLIVLNINHM